MDRERWCIVSIEYLPDKRIIYLSGIIDDNSAENFAEALLQLNTQSKREQIALYIDSARGQINAGLNIYNAVRGSKAPVTGIVFLRAFGAASVILQGCAFRGALPHAEIFIQWNKDYELQNSVDEIYKNRTGNSLSAIKEIYKKNKSISAYEALECRFVDRIL